MAEIRSAKGADMPAVSRSYVHGVSISPLLGETIGVAILNHPSSFRFPTHWHVRTYGLFAANPFGLRHFEKRSGGAHTISEGNTMTLRYRVVLHTGSEKEAGIAELFEQYKSWPHPGATVHQAD